MISRSKGIFSIASISAWLFLFIMIYLYLLLRTNDQHEGRGSTKQKWKRKTAIPASLSMLLILIKAPWTIPETGMIRDPKPFCKEAQMRFYTKQHKFYCALIYTQGQCISASSTRRANLLHRDIKTDRTSFWRPSLHSWRHCRCRWVHLHLVLVSWSLWPRSYPLRSGARPLHESYPRR